MPDDADPRGLTFTHRSPVAGRYLLPEIMGAGSAIIDFNHDGRLDVYLVGGGATTRPAGSRLFEQRTDGTFADVTTTAGVGDEGAGMGVAIGDIDNDGDRDLLLTRVDGNRLFRNNGDGTFTDVTVSAGVAGNGWSTSAAFCDLDNDGFLDLHVATYVATQPAHACQTAAGEADYCGPSAWPGVPDHVYRNHGDGTFEDMSARSGIGTRANRGLGVVCFDADADGDSDVLVANDGEANDLWINNGNWHFEERALMAGIAVNARGVAEANMGIGLGDVNGDEFLDVFITHLDGETNTLFLGSAQHVFRDATPTSGLGPVSAPFTGFGTVLFDADQDGDLDVAIVNGRVRKRPGQATPTSTARDPVLAFVADYGEPNQLLRNDGNGHFTDSCDEAPGFCGDDGVGRGLLAADLDGDGDLDLLATNANGPTRLYRNDAPEAGGWLQVRVIDAARNRDAIGATVRVRAGNRWQVRPVLHTSSYLNSAEASVHFGLGATSHVDAIVVRWPGGDAESFAGVPANTRIALRKGTGSPLP